MYHYGIDETDAWSKIGALYHAPGKFEDRVAKLYTPFFEAMSDKVHASSSLPLQRVRPQPDLIVFSSSFWDLARWAQQDIDSGKSAVSDLDETRLLEWRGRNVDMLNTLSQSSVGGKGSVPILWRSIHYPAENTAATVEWFTGQEQAAAAPAVGGVGTGSGAGAGDVIHKNHPLFHINRIHQLNHAQLSALMPSGDDKVKGKLQRSATIPESVALAPWGQIMLGQDDKQMDPLNPSANPGASLWAEMVLWNLAIYSTAST